MSKHIRFASETTFCIDSDNSDSEGDYFEEKNPDCKLLSHTDLFSLNNTSDQSASRLNHEEEALLKYYNEQIKGKEAEKEQKPKLGKTKVYIQPSKKFIRIVDNAICLLREKERKRELDLEAEKKLKMGIIDVLRASLACDTDKSPPKSQRIDKDCDWENMEFYDLVNLVNNFCSKSEEDVSDVTTMKTSYLKKKMRKLLPEEKMKSKKSSTIIINKIRAPVLVKDTIEALKSHKRSRGRNNEPSPFVTATTCLSHSALSQKKSSVSRSRRTQESWMPHN
ncbi:unnamed protein product [Moneuplotes crassus]|uniref:Uncharacterized protein n=1 Tax=Euplotes crassus TaxID=5936 RepID=A0AAD2D1U4_EUPCR|nr:unnamed protein product [Moneuplotes crassus]